MVSGSVLKKIEEARKRGEQDEKTAEELTTRVQESIMLLELTKEETRATKERLKGDLINAQNCLAENRLHPNPTVRRAVWKALISWYIHPQLSTKEDAENIVAKLLTEGLIQEDPKGTLAILGKSYGVADSLFEEEDIKEMEGRFELFQGRVRAVLKKTANLSVKELVARGKGHICLFVPPEKYVTLAGPRWRAGGTLILESDGRFIKALDAIGKIENVIAEFKKLEEKKLPVKIEVRSLQWKQPPLLPFTNDNEKERSSKTQVLWYLIKRGLSFADWTTKTSAKATLTNKEFFLEKKLGKYFLDLEEAWQDSNPGKEMWISRPVMLVERLEKDDQKCIQLPEVPNHLTDWLAECRECSPEGEQFTGLRQPLQKMLRYCYGKTARNAEKEIAVKTAEEIAKTLA